VDAGEIGRQEARERGQTPAIEGIPDLSQPAPEKLSRPFRDSRSAAWDVGVPLYLVSLLGPHGVLYRRVPAVAPLKQAGAKGGSHAQPGW